MPRVTIRNMEIRGWDNRYRSGERAAEDLEAAPAPLLVETAKQLARISQCAVKRRTEKIGVGQSFKSFTGVHAGRFSLNTGNSAVPADF